MRLWQAPQLPTGPDADKKIDDLLKKVLNDLALCGDPEMFWILLQVMDHGKLTDNNGKPADFRHVILIMTTNVGARELAQRRIGFGDGSNAGADETAFKRLFSPEFRNRLDARVSFSPLEPESMERIVEKFLKSSERKPVVQGFVDVERKKGERKKKKEKKRKEKKERK